MNNKISKKHINLFIVSTVLLIFFFGNIYIFSKLSQVKDVFNPYIFLLIINIDVVFFLTILALSLRYLIKLIFEKSESGKLRKKLSFLLIALVIIPAMILSVSSITLISNATNLWFSGRVEEALKSLNEISEQNINNTKNFLKGVGELVINKKISPEEANRFFNVRIEKRDKNINNTEILEIDNNLMIKYPYKNIVLYYPLDRNFNNTYLKIKRINEVYKKFRYYKNPVRITYITTMLVLTMFVILSAIWFSQYIVRNITYPLEKLVEASKKLAKGNLNVKINIKAPDEIGILIKEFNHMVEELKNLYLKLERNNKELKANKEYLEAILDNARTGVIFSNRFGIIEKINKSASEILKINPKNLEGKDIEEFLKGLSIDISLIDREQTININGKVIMLKITKISPKGYIVVFDDITDILLAEKFMAWKEMARRIAHEIKNPLTPIKLSAERIERQYKNKNPKFEEILKKSINVIKTEVDYLSKLVREFGQLAKTDKELNMENINLNDFIKEIAESYKSDIFDIKVSIPTELNIYGDKELLKQAFINLIQNSYESVLETEKRGYLEIKAILEGNSIKIIFKDNGKGINPDDIKNIFLPYYTNKSKGSGLGLTIVKEIIEKHRGKIKAIPVKDGALFEIILRKDLSS
ncbi:MAG: histidine kinase [Persephonella sp.]|nr:MAG: histidine kinase [Persephonella sp.]